MGICPLWIKIVRWPPKPSVRINAPLRRFTVNKWSPGVSVHYRVAFHKTEMSTIKTVAVTETKSRCISAALAVHGVHPGRRWPPPPRNARCVSQDWVSLHVSVLVLQALGEHGMAHFSDKAKSKGKDYCIFFNSQWARLPQDLHKAVSKHSYCAVHTDLNVLEVSRHVEKICRIY